MASITPPGVLQSVRAVAPLVADEQQTLGRLHERTGDGELGERPCRQCRAWTHPSDLVPARAGPGCPTR